MAHQLPARPDLDHLRGQAKTLLAQLKDGDASAARTFVAHLPQARGLSEANVRAASLQLADAQSAIARKHGFDSWARLADHVERLRALEGEWHFVTLQVDGADMPAAMLTSSRMLIDGDRFRMESPGANYDGRFVIDVGQAPARIDIDFVEGPEAGNRSSGVFELNGDQLTICLGLTGAPRPVAFSTSPGSRHALERLRRVQPGRPAGVTGRTATVTATSAPPPAASSPAAVAADFDVAMTPLLRRLEGTWSAVALVRDGEPMPAQWLSFGSRIATGNEVKVTFGGEVMVHAKVRIDEHATPMAVDYLSLAGAGKGRVSLGIMEWAGDEVRFSMAAPGEPRPASFEPVSAKGRTFSQWRRT